MKRRKKKSLWMSAKKFLLSFKIRERIFWQSSDHFKSHKLVLLRNNKIFLHIYFNFLQGLEKIISQSGGLNIFTMWFCFLFSLLILSVGQRASVLSSIFTHRLCSRSLIKCFPRAFNRNEVRFVFVWVWNSEFRFDEYLFWNNDASEKNNSNNELTVFRSGSCSTRFSKEN